MTVKLWYLASPYSLYRRGHEVAYHDVCQLAAKIIRAHNLCIFSPIAHGHGMSRFGGLPYTDHDLWEGLDNPFVEMCDGLLVGQLEGWDESYGVANEIREFRAAGKPVKYVNPITIEIYEQAAAA